ncbi:DUF6082 family protein [Streptacidiphilus sp. N1-12]|uniref:DUF6082 family protein n=2 Tax=Streptacidiphilus alkalitolerans TaxID=3342712 RepID=A0ABV6VKC7_9ACTN
MDSTEGTAGTVWQYTWKVLVALILLAVIAVACVALSGWMNDSVVSLSGSMGRAKDLGTVGQYFDAGSAVFSGIALLLVIVTTVMQRRELAMQRDSLGKSQWELHRSAETEMRKLHMDLIKMAIDDDSLAKLWSYDDSIPAEQVRQYLYANLIFSHLLLNHELHVIDETNILGHIHGVARSPIFREYWVASASARALLNQESTEYKFGQLIDSILQQPPDPPDGLRVA